MIINIPTPKDFDESGKDYLNLAWDSTINLIIRLADATESGWDTDEAVNVEYWQAAQRTLSTAISLTQQGTDFLLKSHISNESPFLLIAGGPSDWPRGCDKKDVPFSDFKTIDSQDLVRAYNTIASRKLSTTFINQHENLRNLRNTIMHTVNKEIQINAKDVLIAVLEANQELGNAGKWIEIRRQFLEREPDSVVFSSDYVENVLSREITTTIEILTKSEATKYFNFNKGQRKYLCANCSEKIRDFDEPPKLAQLKPNKPDSTNLYCILCGQTRDVLRKDCKHKDCEGNVIDREKGVCSTCNCPQ